MITKPQTHQNIWDTEKAVLKRKFRTINVYTHKPEISQIDNFTLQLNELEKEDLNPKLVE